MASEESELSSNSGVDGSPSPSGHYAHRRKAKAVSSPVTENSRRAASSSKHTVDSSSSSSSNGATKSAVDSCKPVFHVEPIDPESDRAIVIDAVHFVLRASNKGCFSLVSKFAEYLKYKISLEEKVLQLTSEVKKLKRSGSGRSSPISLHSEVSKLAKSFGGNNNKAERNTHRREKIDFVLPGFVPPVPPSSPQRSPKPSSPRAFIPYNATSSLPKLSQKDDSFCFQKISADAKTQTNHGDVSDPVMVDKACSLDSQIDSYKTLQGQLENANKLIAQLKHELSLAKHRKIDMATSKDVDTQTDDTLTLSEDRLACLSRSRSNSGLSLTNTSTKSFPGVTKNKCECCATGCDKTRKSKNQSMQNTELLPSIGERVLVKGCGMGTVKFVGKLEGSRSGLNIGLCLDKPVGENDGTWRLFRCPPNRGVFVPVQDIKRVKTNKDANDKK